MATDEDRVISGKSGRLRVIVDAGHALFRYFDDEPPGIGDVIQARSGGRFMVEAIEVDEAQDRCHVKAIQVP